MESCCHSSISAFPKCIQDLIIRTYVSNNQVSKGSPLAAGRCQHSPVSKLGIGFWLFDFSTAGGTIVIAMDDGWKTGERARMRNKGEVINYKYNSID